ncbi:hypothetical protein [Lysinibacillus sp. ACHW1.5]|uniref:TcaA NTF2-like domain-containing protein n=1 Tax=Lysinibacillus sp. ACHW1.5 TaxID=2913506 RepID=UPI001EDAC439|nr:hypothetical protein [Lysinibacillus sp. ACHW1.5]UKJ47500.1 hypothetical protein L6W14_10770 [Lysinibacillus sp. ACHW1.5]
MYKKVLILGATAFLVAGCDSQIGTGWFQNKKAEVESEGAVTKQQEKIVPEVKVIGEYGVGAGIIIRQQDDQLYILTNGALVASKPTALVQFGQDKLVAATIHVMSTAYNMALLRVTYQADVQVPNLYEGELNHLAVYVNGLPYTIQKYQDKVAAYYIKAEQSIPLGSPVMEAENGAIVGLYVNRQQQGASQPYILPIKEFQASIDEWIEEGMTASVRLSQSKNLYPYIEQGDKEAVQQAIEQYGENIFAYNTDEIMLFLDTFHKYLKGAVTTQDASVLKPIVGTEAIQETLASMVAYYASKQAKIHFSNTDIQAIRVEGQRLIVQAKTEYILTNAAGQEALAYSNMLYELEKNEQGEYKLLGLTNKE